MFLSLDLRGPITVALVYIFCVFFILVNCNGQGKYLASYNTLPFGITFIEIFFMHGGPVQPNVKWIAECFDQQAFIGLKDTGFDFTQLQTVKCRTMFHHKPPTAGFYPYYDRCALHNMTGNEDYYCFNPELHPNSINTFMTAIWDDDPWFRIWLLRTPKTHSGTAFKCCGLPAGYYINYAGCFTRFTHDDNYEYYDLIYFTMECPDNFVMTGLGIHEDPYNEDPHYDWIQCCPVYFDPLTMPVAHLVGPPFAAPELNEKPESRPTATYPISTTWRPSSVTPSSLISNSSVAIPKKFHTSAEKVAFKNKSPKILNNSDTERNPPVISDAAVNPRRHDPSMHHKPEIPTLGASIVQYINALASRKLPKLQQPETSSGFGRQGEAPPPLIVITSRQVPDRDSKDDDYRTYRNYES